jgi:hypothetical protein
VGLILLLLELVDRTLLLALQKLERNPISVLLRLLKGVVAQHLVAVVL